MPIEQLAPIAGAVLVGLGSIHGIMGLLFHRYLTATRPIEPPVDYRPRAIVVVCVRGEFPFLGETLRSLAAQDYPDYSVRVVVDSEADPSWATVTRAASRTGETKLTAEVLRQHGRNRSLKCSALVQAVETLEDDAEILVLCDADVVPHRGWLRDLVAPLSVPKIGLATGSQWFEPLEATVGSLVRHAWHAGAIVPTVLYRHPWAGSCALRVRDVRETGLLERWRTAAVDDGAMAKQFRSLRRKVHVVPEAVIVNRETCSLRSCFAYVRRILTWSRFYEGTFFLTPVHMFSMALALGVSSAFLGWGVAVGHGGVIGTAAAGLAFFALSMLATYRLIDSAVIRVVRERGDSIEKTGGARLLAIASLFPLAVCVYCAALVPAMFRRRVNWRGATYEIRGPWNVRLILDSAVSSESQRGQSGELDRPGRPEGRGLQPRSAAVHRSSSSR